MNTKILSLALSLMLTLNPLCLTAYCATNKYNKSQTNSIQAGNKYAQLGHKAFNEKKYLQSAEYYEKAYKANPVKLYKDNAITAYMSFAFESAQNNNYDNSIKYCNKVLSVNPENKNAKELLSDIYYARGADYFYNGNLDKAKSDIENSLKYSTIPDQKNRATDSLNKIQLAITQGLKPAPKHQITSIPDQITLMEQKIYGTANQNAPLLDRVSKLESTSYNKTFNTESLVSRVNRLKNTIIPELADQNVVENSNNPFPADTYIKEIYDQSQGKVSIFGKMPITIYINDANVKPYKKFYTDSLKEGFNEWEIASENRIKFEFINNPAKADIQVVWQEDFEDFPWQPVLTKEDISAEQQRMKYRKADAAVRLGSIAAMLAGGLIGIPVIGGLGAVGSSVASPLLQYKGLKTEKLSHDIKVNTRITQGMTDDQAKLKIKQIAIHQIGHALGIYGHSPDPNDIMYSNFSVNQLSQRDINTIKEIYKSLETTKD